MEQQQESYFGTASCGAATVSLYEQHKLTLHLFSAFYHHDDDHVALCDVPNSCHDAMAEGICVEVCFNCSLFTDDDGEIRQQPRQTMSFIYCASVRTIDVFLLTLPPN